MKITPDSIKEPVSVYQNAFGMHMSGKNKPSSTHDEDDDEDFEESEPEDLTEEDTEDLPPIVDGGFDDVDDDEVDKKFDSHRHYEDEIDEDEDDEEF